MWGSVELHSRSKYSATRAEFKSCTKQSTRAEARVITSRMNDSANLKQGVQTASAVGVKVRSDTSPNDVAQFDSQSEVEVAGGRNINASLSTTTVRATCTRMSVLRPELQHSVSIKAHSRLISSRGGAGQK
jgi:hypothetical protein